MNASAMCGEQENRLERMRQRMKAKKKKEQVFEKRKEKLRATNVKVRHPVQFTSFTPT